MGALYKITNNINGKMYIGKTETTVKRRWNNHKAVARSNNFVNRPLYAAFNKYGLENFTFEVLVDSVELSGDALNELEIEMISTYNTYKNGYNVTLGGEGSTTLKFEESEINEMIRLYNEFNTIEEIAEMFNTSDKTISKILNDRIQLKSSVDYKKANSVLNSTITVAHKDHGQLTFNTAYELVDFIKTNAISMSGRLNSMLALLINGKRPNVLGFSLVSATHNLK